MSQKLSDGSIRKRAVLYFKKDGVFIFPGWALTTTTLGTMAEPFILNNRYIAAGGIGNFDPSDPMARVDELRGIDSGDIGDVISSGESVTGGNLLPRVFKLTGEFV